jgi:hypothetical protein
MMIVFFFREKIFFGRADAKMNGWASRKAEGFFCWPFAGALAI